MAYEREERERDDQEEREVKLLLLSYVSSHRRTKFNFGIQLNSSSAVAKMMTIGRDAYILGSGRGARQTG